MPARRMFCALVVLMSALARAEDWPQLAHDAGRSGATPAQLAPPFTRKWYRLFANEGIQAGVQPVVAGDRLFIATLRGRLHAIDTRTGKDAWVYSGEGPAMHTAAVTGGRVFVAIGDTLHAVNVADGSKAWTVKTPLTIWNAPAVHDGVVYFGGRDGMLYAIDARSGETKWRAATGAPILNSVAIDAKNRRVLVGAEDMTVHAFDLVSGRPLWHSAKLPGVSFRGYHPVVAPDGSVVITVTPCAGGDAIQQCLLDMAKEVFGNFASWRIKSADEKKRLRAENFGLMAKPETYAKQLDYLRKRLTDEPALQTFFVLDGASGRQKFVAPIVYAESMNGPASPPIVTPDGRVIVKYNFLSRSRYEHYSPFLNVGYLDTATGNITPLMDERRTYGWHDSLLLVHDEQSQLMVTGRTLINTHQDNVNALDLVTLEGAKQPWAHGVHEVQPGVATALWAMQLHGKELPPGWEWAARGTAVYGGGSAIDVPIVVAGDSFYFLPTHEINAGVALVAYAMDASGKSGEKPKADAIVKETLAADDWPKVLALDWDWDTMEMPRLNATLKGLPAKPGGTRLNPLTEEAKAKAAAITDEQLDALILSPPARPELPESPHRAALAKSVEELIGHPWRPLLFPAGKAPAEAYRLFNDPTETLYTLALAYPHLPPELQAKVKAHVVKLGDTGGPLGRKTYDAMAGTIRSSYFEAPASLLKMASEIVRSDTARLYPFYLWAANTGDWDRLRRDWPTLKALIKPEPPTNEPDLGNSRLSGVIAACRIARQLSDQEAGRSFLAATREQLRARLRLEFAHTEGNLITTHGNRSLFGRWHHLSPDLAAILRTFAKPIHQRLMSVYVDHHRPAWYVAWNTELLWRNENPFSFPDMSADIFAARVMILGERGESLTRFLDVPWCEGDEYYVQKLALLCAASKD